MKHIFFYLSLSILTFVTGCVTPEPKVIPSYNFLENAANQRFDEIMKTGTLRVACINGPIGRKGLAELEKTAAVQHLKLQVHYLPAAEIPGHVRNGYSDIGIMPLTLQRITTLNFLPVAKFGEADPPFCIFVASYSYKLQNKLKKIE